MTQKITQCPKCATAFRVTDAQLAIARGAVRCGACLHIFNANDHWRGGAPAATQPAAPVPAAAASLADDPLPPAAPAAPEFDTALPPATSGAAQQPQDLSPPPPETEAPEAPVQSEAEPRFSDTYSPFGDGLPDESDYEPSGAPTDEPLADDDILIDDTIDFGELIGEESDDGDTPIFASDSQPLISGDMYAGEDFAAGGSRARASADSRALFELDALDEAASSLFKDHDIERETREGADEQWARILLEELEDEPPPPPRARPAPRPDPLLASVPEIDAETAEADLDKHDDHNAHRDALDSDPDEHWTPGEISALMAGERIGDERRPGLAIEPEPLELVLGGRHRRRWLTAIEIGGCALAAMLLVWQVVYFNFENWSRGPERAALGKVCAVLGCELASPISLDAIRTSNLIVRSHPQQPGALVVDAVITNTAAYPQPFPALLLQFSDMQGLPVAGSVFSAAQYLGGELSGATLMPPRQPVHISLEILDPGAAATNYHLALALPD